MHKVRSTKHIPILFLESKTALSPDVPIDITDKIIKFYIERLTKILKFSNFTL